ncbi:DUF4249 family protein [Algoriphagus confluentis]|uniref:DUF4249 family protein n=1 Tax=Algoriphagus confluentis TaxID=1697556 RepID=UPI0030C769B4
MDEIKLNLSKEVSPVLVVDAWIGPKEGQSYVQVFTSGAYVSGSADIGTVSVELVDVFLEREDGKKIPFKRQWDDKYYPQEEINPEEGESFRLIFQTIEGENFESSWEKFPPSVQVEDMEVNAIERLVLIPSQAGNLLQTRTFAEVNVEISDPGKGNLGYLSTSKGISELFTKSNFDNCLCTCYRNEPNLFKGMNFQLNENFEGRSYQKKIGEIPLSSFGRFYVETTLRVLNVFGSEYFEQVSIQQRNTGSIFDPAPFRIKGNIRKSNGGNEVVLGGLFLFQETRYTKMFSRSEIRRQSLSLNHYLEPLVSVAFSCDEYFTDASPFKPSPFLP